MKKKMLLTIGIIVTVIGLVLIGAGLLEKKNQKDHILDGPGMMKEPDVIYFSYYHGGSSIGDLFRITLEGASFTTEECKGNGHPTIKKTYNIPSNIYFELEDIIYKYHINEWTDLPDSDLFALDAATTSVNIGFRNGSSIYFSSNKQLPENGWDAVDEMRALFEKIMDKQ